MKNNLSQPLKIICLIALMAIIGFLGLNAKLRGGLEFRFPTEIRPLLKPLDVSDTNSWIELMFQNMCRINDDNADIRLTCNPKPGPLAVVWGDSHATYLIPGLLRLQESSSFNVLQFATTSCPPVLNVDDEYLFRKQCHEISKIAMEQIAKLKPQLLIIGSTYREPRYFWDPDYFQEKFSATIQYIHKISSDTKIIVIGPLPRWYPSAQSYTFHRWLWNNPLYRPRNLPIRGNPYHLNAFDEVLKNLAVKDNFQYISPREIMCNDEGCINRVGDSYKDFIAFDYAHFSKSGSEYFINEIKEKILENLVPSK